MRNKKEFWHSNITDKSFEFLKKLRKEFDFVLIGGWAIYFYTKSLKSKDIDIICDFETLSKIRGKYDIFRNDRLKKYEFKADGFDTDIYIPHFSEIGLDINEIIKNPQSLEGFKVPEKEKMLALKLFAYKNRKGSLKGEKDKIDIISIIYFTDVDWNKFAKILKENNFDDLKSELKELLKNMFEVKELDLNKKQFADFKKRIIIEFEKE